MNDIHAIRYPSRWEKLHAETASTQFGMASEPLVGALLRTLAAGRPGTRILELGTGTGLSTSWLLDGMSRDASLLTMDNDPTVLGVARRHLGDDTRLTIACEDGDAFVRRLASAGERFDFIFADTWAGKYRLVDETLTMLNPNGFYVIDDMLPQPNWPDDHPPKVAALLAYLDGRTDLCITKQSWSCGVVICTKAASSLP